MEPPEEVISPDATEALPGPTAATVMIVDDVSANVSALSGALESAGYRVLAALSGEAALKAATKARPDLILLDVLMPGIDGIETCRRLKRSPTTALIPVIFITANDEKTSLVAGFQAGGVDFIAKPFQIDEVLARVATHCNLARLTRELRQRSEELERANARLRAEITRRESAEAALRLADEKLSLLSDTEIERWGSAGFVGRSAAFRALLQAVRRVQGFRTNVLLTGESGTGKELVARAIHFGGPLARGPFVAVNCSALPPDQAESFLFGHVRGAFTGATTDRKGCFESAHEGTLFLDEIGDMPGPLQTKLLRVLEDGRVQAVGAAHGRQVTVRVVAATNADLPAKVAQGHFRQDLYYRLMHFHVPVPTLRERLEDVPALAAHFVKLLSAELKRKPPTIHPSAIERLVSHQYPGNIRELKNTIERALIYATGDQLRADHVIFAPQAELKGAQGEKFSPDALAALPLNLAEVERLAIRRALAAANGNISAAARLLGVHRSKLHRLAAVLDAPRADAGNPLGSGR
jgi:DNA-binding NtrC family response regulator